MPSALGTAEESATSCGTGRWVIGQQLRSSQKPLLTAVSVHSPGPHVLGHSRGLRSGSHTSSKRDHVRSWAVSLLFSPQGFFHCEAHGSPRGQFRWKPLLHVQVKEGMCGGGCGPLGGQPQNPTGGVERGLWTCPSCAALFPSSLSPPSLSRTA